MKIISNQINPHFTLWDACCAIGKILPQKNNSNWPELFGTNHYKLTNTARTALGVIADTVQPDKNKRIGIPAFICAVVATPFLERGYEICWIDVDENGVIDPIDFKNKSDQISLVIVPHIFGQPAPLKDIYKTAQSKNIFVIEDGAHLLIKNFDHCDAKIWSFGREKVISCVSGGALLWDKKSPYHDAFKNLDLIPADYCWQIRHALQPLIFAIAQPWWHIGGKIIPAIALKLKILPLAVTPAEKKGKENIPLKKLGNIQARILWQQAQKYIKRKEHAQDIANQWHKTLSKILPKNTTIETPKNAFRVLVKFSNGDAKSQFLAQNKKSLLPFHLRDWDGIPISPNGIRLSKFGYNQAQCPQAERYARTYLSFPTNIRVSKKDIKGLEKALVRSKI